MVTTGTVDLLYKGGGPNVPTLYLLTGVRAEGGAMSEANKELVGRRERTLWPCCNWESFNPQVGQPP